LEKGQIKLVDDVNNCINLYLGNSQFKKIWNGNIDNEYLNINKTAIFNEKDSDIFYNNEVLFIRIEFTVKKNINEIGVGFVIKSQFDDNLIRCFYNDFNNQNTFEIGKHAIIFKIPKTILAAGRYKIEFDISRPSIEEFTKGRCDLYFELMTEGVLGNRYFGENSPKFGSIVRPDWTYEIIRLTS